MPTNRPRPKDLTKQGVRDLDQLGRPPRRGHVGRQEVLPPSCLAYHDMVTRVADDGIAVTSVCLRCGHQVSGAVAAGGHVESNQV